MTAEERKNNSESILEELQVPVNKNLPLTEEETEVRIRAAEEIATRILILAYLNYVKADENKEEVIDYLKKQHLWECASEEEKSLFLKKIWTRQQIVDVSWRSEAIRTMLWAIGKTGPLELPAEQCKVAEIIKCLPAFFGSPASFLETAEVRPVYEILDMTDFTYRLHWAVRDAELKGEEAPGNFHPGIIYERHYALNWITCYEEDWDDITCDT